MKAVQSPFTTGFNTRHVKDYDVATICALYVKHFGFDVSQEFGNIETFSLYECKDSGARFFYPRHIAGSNTFYAQLQEACREWYYPEWRWDYTATLERIDVGADLLEIGCGSGQFLDRARQVCGRVVGLEINDKACAAALQRGLDVRLETIEEHARLQPSCYNVVCCFQVLEHVDDVASFMIASVGALKPQGQFIVAVPNNRASFFTFERPLIRFRQHLEGTQLLNMPPHHMNLWDKTSLRKMAKFFPIDVRSTRCESLPEMRYGMQAEIFRKKYLPEIVGDRPRVIRWSERAVRLARRHLAGDSVLVEFRKAERAVGMQRQETGVVTVQTSNVI